MRLSTLAAALMVPAAIVSLATPAAAATAREMLASAAFDASTKPAALALVTQAIATADAALAANPADREAQLARATGIGYRAKLTRSPGDAKTCRTLLEQYAAANPRDGEALLGIGGWHLDSVDAGFLTAGLLGAKKDVGLAAIDRAVAVGGDRAFFKGFAALLRLRLNPGDPAAKALAQQASAAPTPMPLDRIAKRDATAVLALLNAGDAKGAAVLARRLLPFGKL